MRTIQPDEAKTLREMLLIHGAGPFPRVVMTRIN